MKKILATVLVLVFALMIPGAAYAAEPVVIQGSGEGIIWVRVKISADESYTNPTEVYNQSGFNEFLALVNGSKKSSVKVADTKELARLTFYFENNTNETYVVYKAADGALYIKKGNKLRLIDSGKFYTLVDESSRNFYKLRNIPAVKVAGSAVPVAKSSYAFEKLDGKFYKTQYDYDEVMSVMVDTAAENSGKIIFAPGFSIQPKSVRVRVTLGGEPVWSGALDKISEFDAKTSGTYLIEYIVTYDQPHAKGEVVYAYEIDCRINTAIAFSVDGAGTNPGEVVVLRAKNIPEGSKVTVDTDIQFTPQFFREAGGDMIALLPVSYYTAPGGHYVQLKCGDAEQRFGITAGDKKFEVQQLTVPPSTTAETINSQKANDEYEKNIAPLRPVADSKQYWSGRFMWPLKDNPRVTTSFGTIRYTNGGSTPSRHGAIDFAAPAGTPVYASGAGRVLFSGFLQLTGNTIVIEHGYGLKTWHYHMNGRNVKTGDMVEQGQQIGVVGSTGFSTGAHLHFGMSVNNVFVNPETAVTTDLLA